MENHIKEIRYALPLDLIEMIAGYLGTRPYSEVRPIIARIERESLKVELPLNDNEKEST